MLSETKALGLYFEYKNYTTYADPKKTKQIRCSVKNILKQARCLRSILAPKVKRFPAKLSVAVAKKKNKNLKKLTSLSAKKKTNSAKRVRNAKLSKTQMTTKQKKTAKKLKTTTTRQ